MSSMYKLSRIMNCSGQLSERTMREQLLETLISEGYKFDPKYVVVGFYDEEKDKLDFVNPGIPPIKLRALNPLLVEGINYMAETNTNRGLVENAVEVLWYVEKTEDRKLLKRTFKVIVDLLNKKTISGDDVSSIKMQDKPLIEIFTISAEYEPFYIPQNFSVKDVLGMLLSKGDFPKTVEEGMDLYNSKKKMNLGHNKALKKQIDFERI